MNATLLAVPSDDEQLLAARTEPAQLTASLGENEAVDHHARIRRARNRHSEPYRRGARRQAKRDNR